jgi:hypothetical protein
LSAEVEDMIEME